MMPDEAALAAYLREHVPQIKGAIAMEPLERWPMESHVSPARGRAPVRIAQAA